MLSGYSRWPLKQVVVLGSSVSLPQRLHKGIKAIPFGKWTKSHNHTGMQKKYQGKRPEKCPPTKMTDLFPFLPVYFGAGPVQILT